MVLADEGACLPILAEIPRVIVKQVGLAAEIMPIMSIDTLSLVVGFDVGAPLSLEVVHIERVVALHLVDEACLDVLVGVCEGAELLVVADISLVSAKLGFVFLDMVQPFHPIVGSLTRFFLVALF